MRDSLNVSKLLNLCVDRSILLPNIYLQPIAEILQICARPFLKEKSSDKIVYSKIYTDLISQLGRVISGADRILYVSLPGYTFRLDNVDVRLQICKSLYDLYSQVVPVDKLQGKTSLCGQFIFKIEVGNQGDSGRRVCLFMILER